MAGRKRKAVALFECECENDDHDSQRGCDEAAKSRLLRSVTSKILPFSKIATVLVGPEKQMFNLPQDLLTLHSTFFREHFARADQKIVLTAVNAIGFKDFVDWLYISDVQEELIQGIEEDTNTILDREWTLGNFLGAPAYQNDCIRAYRDHCQGSNSWPDIQSVRDIYEITPLGSKLRKFAADSMATQSPFKRHPRGSPEFAEWNALLQQYPELSIDIVHASAREWNGTLPWDDENLNAYMEDETPLDQAWEEQILAKRDIDTIKKEAQKKMPS